MPENSTVWWNTQLRLLIVIGLAIIGLGFCIFWIRGIIEEQSPSILYLLSSAGFLFIALKLKKCAKEKPSDCDSPMEDFTNIECIGRKPRNDATVDIVFVHGLGGNAMTTWHPYGKDECYFPKWLSEDFPQSNVWSLSYPAEATQWIESESGQGMVLPQRGRQVLEYLATHRENLGRRHLIFVAHSLGGLLVKQLLRIASDSSTEQYKPILANTGAVFFLATPHKGSNLATLLEHIKLARPTATAKDLKAHNPYLADLGEWYRHNVKRLRISTGVYMENKKYKGVWIVDRSSADPGIDSCNAIPQDADHFEIAKPTSKDHPIYSGVRGFIDGHLNNVQRDPEASELAINLVRSETTSKEHLDTSNEKFIVGRNNDFIIRKPSERWDVTWKSINQQLASIGASKLARDAEAQAFPEAATLLDLNLLEIQSRHIYIVEAVPGITLLNGLPALTTMFIAPQGASLHISSTNKYSGFIASPNSLATVAAQALSQQSRMGMTNFRTIQPMLRLDGQQALIAEGEFRMSKVIVNGQDDQELTTVFSLVFIEGPTQLFQISLRYPQGPSVDEQEIEELRNIVKSFSPTESIDPEKNKAAAILSADKERKKYFSTNKLAVMRANYETLHQFLAPIDLNDPAQCDSCLNNIQRFFDLGSALDQDMVEYMPLHNAWECAKNGQFEPLLAHLKNLSE